MGEERGGSGGRGSSAPSGVASVAGGVLHQKAGDAELCFLYLTRIHNASQWLNLMDGVGLGWTGLDPATWG